METPTQTVSEDVPSVGIDSNDAKINAIIESTIPVPEPISEPVTEPVSDLTKTIKSAPISTLLRIVITGKLSSLSIPLDKTISAILLELLDETPKTFDRIQESVELIVQDGKLNTADIPQILKLLSELYPLVKHTKLRPSSLECAKIVGTIIKVVIHVLVNEHKIKVSNPTQFLKELDKLVDMAIELLSLAKTVKQQSSKCSKLFHK